MAEISIKKAAIINAGAKYSTIVLNLFFTGFLARLLTPADYGVVAVANVFTTFFALFANMGIGSGIIQNKTLTDDDIASIFTFSIRLGLVLCVLFSLFSVPMSLFYKDSVYIPVGILLSFSLMLNTFNMVPNALLMKEKKFFSIAIRTIVTCVVSGAVGIFFAFLHFKYYAIVLQSILSALFIFVWNYFSTRPRLVRSVKRESIGKIRQFSSFLFAFNIVNYFSRNTDNLLISKFMGAEPLGHYDKAYKLMCYPTQNFSSIIESVLHPILSEYQDDKEYIYKKYMEIVKLLSLVGAFVMPFCFFAAEEIIRIAFGEKWLSAIPCFKLLSVSIWAQMVTTPTGGVFASLGDTKRMFVRGLLNSILTVVAIVSGIIGGDIVSVSRNVGIVFCVHFFTTYFILIRGSFKMSFLSFLVRLVPDLIIMALLCAFGFAMNGVLSGTEMNVVLLFSAKLACMGVAYLLLLVIFRQHKHLLKIVRK